MATIKSLHAREILDSRGVPTIETEITADSGESAIASIPSGTSTGRYEARELRDDDPQRYGGMGVLKAVEQVNTVIAPKLVGRDPMNQTDIDQALVVLDGTPDKSRLGANGILSVSQAVCELGAALYRVPTFQYIHEKYRLTNETLSIPTPIFNVINGGKHGAGNLDFQEFHLIPATNKSYPDALRCGEEIYQMLGNVLDHRGAIHSVGSEGGYAPNLYANIDALELILEAIKEARYTYARDVFLGLDVAANSFFTDGKYAIRDKSNALNRDELITFYQELNERFHLVSIEDPLHEDDFDGWAKLTSLFSASAMIVGDDLLTSSPVRVKTAIEKKLCTAILVKPNQIGTISETIEVIALARKAGWSIIVSHRSGETEDDFIADFAVGTGANYVKFGAPSRGERVIKYNRLSKIFDNLQNRKP